MLDVIDSIRDLGEDRFIASILIRNCSPIDIDIRLAEVRRCLSLVHRESLSLAKLELTYNKDFAVLDNKRFSTAEMLFNRLRSSMAYIRKTIRKTCKRSNKNPFNPNFHPSIFERSVLTKGCCARDLYGITSFEDNVQALYYEQQALFANVILSLSICYRVLKEEKEIKGDPDRCVERLLDQCQRLIEDMKDILDFSYDIPEPDIKIMIDNMGIREFAGKNFHETPLKDLAMYVAGNVLFTDSAFDVTACESLIDLRGKYLRLKTEVDSCQDAQYLVTDQGQCSLALTGVTQVLANGQTTTVNNASVALNCDTINTYNLIDGGTVQLGKDTYRVNAAVIAAVNRCKNACNTKSTRTETEACSFKQLKNYSNANDVYCTNPGDTSCMNRATAQQQVATLDKVFNRLTVLNGQESNRAKGAVVGATVGLGAGGVATAITAFVERNNISCRVGDGLTTVGLGKSYTIESLKDYYVKWNLRVADSISPTARVTSCQDWIDTCGLYTTAEDCNNVVINYQRPNRNTTTEVRSACRMSGSVCIENRSVAVSYGACTRSGIVPPVGPITPVNPNANNQAVLDIIEH